MNNPDRTYTATLGLAFIAFILYVGLAACATHTNLKPETLPGLVDIRLLSLTEVEAHDTYVVKGDSHKWALDNLVKWSAKRNLNIIFVDLSAQNMFGQTRCAGQCVVFIDPSYPANSQLDTVLHELAHMLIRPSDPSSAEIIAEAVAMLTAQQLGLDTSQASLAYIGKFSPMTIQGTLFTNSPQINYAVGILVAAAKGK